MLLWLFFPLVFASDDEYFLGALGDSCTATCYQMGLNCDPDIQTGNNTHLFKHLGVQCVADRNSWWAVDQPNFLPDPTSPIGLCTGFVNVPQSVNCGGSSPYSQRLCRCVNPSNKTATFGTAYPGGYLDENEYDLFSWVLEPGDVGVMNHFWMTFDPGMNNGILVRYYVDGEQIPSIAFNPAFACGVGFGLDVAPWGNSWFGKGSGTGGWYFDFRIPFRKSIYITISTTGVQGNVWTIVRGGLNVPINIGGINIPLATGRLHLQFLNIELVPYQSVNLATLPAGTRGVYFAHSGQFISDSLGFFEGCYRVYTPDTSPFPGLVLSSGLEDYFNSAWGFDSGTYAFQNAGLTSFNRTDSGVSLSAYRLHETDVVQFWDGVIVGWRNGELLDKSGTKCSVNINPDEVEDALRRNMVTELAETDTTQLLSYVWLYTY